ncbi:MAG: hypothetical protein HGA97_07800 [Chlorobiaceae bacterium]|nr:hypothetical protein [Chlorobiaceae bacterium]
MKQSWLWILLPLAVSLMVFGFFFALFPDRFFNGEMLFWPVSLLALASGVVCYAPVRGFHQAWNLSSVIGVVISVIALLAAGCGVALDLNGIHAGAMIAGVISVTAIALLPVVTDLEITGGNRKKASGAPDAGGPSIWADRIEAVGRRCTRPELKTKLLRLGGETRFLTSGADHADMVINHGIARAIEELSETIKLGNESSALSMLSTIRSLFAQRENQLKP